MSLVFPEKVGVDEVIFRRPGWPGLWSLSGGSLTLFRGTAAQAPLPPPVRRRGSLRHLVLLKQGWGQVHFTVESFIGWKTFKCLLIDEGLPTQTKKIKWLQGNCSQAEQILFHP